MLRTAGASPDSRTSSQLSDVIRFSPASLGGDLERRLILLQVLHAVVDAHAAGEYHGRLTPDHVHLEWGLAVRVTDFPSSSSQEDTTVNAEASRPGQPRRPTQSGLAPPRTPRESTGGLDALTDAWMHGALSNLDYILELNRLSGRRWGDMRFHFFVPWPLDFSCHPGVGLRQTTQEECAAALPGWRDLKWSRYAMFKGHEQLDSSYAESRYHVADVMLPELTFCLYLARRLPFSVLRSKVRNPVRAEEYAADVRQLYERSPDEAIPEFFTDGTVFRSTHDALPDLAVPDWAASLDEFLQLHRAALESERVSLQLHHWIDVSFGYKLSGEAARNAKNVHIKHATDPRHIHDVGVVQLFRGPHPQRLPRHLRQASAAPGVSQPADRRTAPDRSVSADLDTGDAGSDVRLRGGQSADVAGPPGTACGETPRVLGGAAARGAGERDFGGPPLPSARLFAELRALEEHGLLPLTLMRPQDATALEPQRAQTAQNGPTHPPGSDTPPESVPATGLEAEQCEDPRWTPGLGPPPHPPGRSQATPQGSERAARGCGERGVAHCWRGPAAHTADGSAAGFSSDVTSLARLAVQLYTEQLLLDGWPDHDGSGWADAPLPRPVLSFVHTCLGKRPPLASSVLAASCQPERRDQDASRPVRADELLSCTLFTPEVWAAFRFMRSLFASHEAIVGRMARQTPPPGGSSQAPATKPHAAQNGLRGVDEALPMQPDLDTPAQNGVGFDFARAAIDNPYDETGQAGGSATCALVWLAACAEQMPHEEDSLLVPPLPPERPAAQAVLKLACRALSAAYQAVPDAAALERALLGVRHAASAAPDGASNAALPTPKVIAAFADVAHDVWSWLAGSCDAPHAASWLVPTWVECVQASQSRQLCASPDWQAALGAVLFSDDLHDRLLQACGLELYASAVIPAVVGCVAQGPPRGGQHAATAACSHAVVAVAVALLPAICRRLLLPTCCRLVIQPLLRSIKVGTLVVLALVEVSTALSAQDVYEFMVTPLMRLLATPPPPLHPSAAAKTASAYQAVVLDVLTALDGLLSLLEPHLVLSAFVLPAIDSEGPLSDGPAVAPLVQMLLYPVGPQGGGLGEGLSVAIRARVAALLVHACRMAGGTAVAVEHVLPQVLPLFTCAPSSRAAYGRVARADEDGESGYWNLIHVLYPHIVEAAGTDAVRGVLARQWLALEEQLCMRYGWAVGSHSATPLTNLSLRHNLQLSLLEKGLTSGPAKPPTGRGRKSSAQTDSSRMKDALEGTALMLGGVGWHTPPTTLTPRELRRSNSDSQRRPFVHSSPPSPGAGTAGGKSTGGPASAAAAQSGSSGVPGHQAAAPWAALSLDDLAGPGCDPTWSQLLGPASPLQALLPVTPWQIRGVAARGWRAHRERVHCAVVCPLERVLVTAGRGLGARESSEVVRAWTLTSLAPGVQYLGHRRAVLSMAFVRSRPLTIASVDASGALHFWDAQTGACLQTFGEAGQSQGHSQSRESSSPDMSARVWSAPIADAVNAAPAWGDLTSYLALAAGKHHTCVAALLGLAKAQAVSGAVDGSLQLWSLCPPSCCSTLQVFGDPMDAGGAFPAVAAVTCLWTAPASEIGSQGSDHPGPRAGLVATGSAAGHAALVDVSCGLVHALWPAHSDSVAGVAVQGDRVVTCSAAIGSPVKVWQVQESALTAANSDAEGSPRVLNLLAVTTTPAVCAELRTNRLEAVAGVQVQCGHLLVWTATALLLGPNLLDRSAGWPNSDLTVVRFVEKHQLATVSAFSQLVVLPVSRLIMVSGDDGRIRVCL